jgi:hypothetical protein
VFQLKKCVDHGREHFTAYCRCKKCKAVYIPAVTKHPDKGPAAVCRIALFGGVTGERVSVNLYIILGYCEFTKFENPLL